MKPNWAEIIVGAVIIAIIASVLSWTAEGLGMSSHVASAAGVATAYIIVVTGRRWFAR